jgi:exodeoxyribonuclease III
MTDARAALEALTVPVLKERLLALKLPVSGAKGTLVDRLVALEAIEGSRKGNSSAGGIAADAGNALTSQPLPKPRRASPPIAGRATVPRDPTARRPAPSEDAHVLRAVSWNVNGLRALLKRPDPLLALLDQERPHVVFLQETKLQEVHVAGVQENLRLLLAPLGFDYEAHFTCSATKKGYSGVALLLDRKRCPAGYTVTTGLDSSQARPLNGDLDSSTAAAVAEDEGRVLTVTWGGLVLVAAYVPNSGEDLKRLAFRTGEWDPALAAHLAGAGDAVMACGDFNVAVHDADFFNPTEKRSRAP